MTTAPSSMRFAPTEILSGMLAGIEGSSRDDPARRAATFDALAARSPLFTRFASTVDPNAVADGLAGLEGKGVPRGPTGVTALLKPSTPTAIAASALYPTSRIARSSRKRVASSKRSSRVLKNSTKRTAQRRAHT